jgi:hypothetical protein
VTFRQRMEESTIKKVVEIENEMFQHFNNSTEGPYRQKTRFVLHFTVDNHSD